MRASAAYRMQTAKNMLLRYFLETFGRRAARAGGAPMTVAKPLPHDAARLHVTGAARYVDDIPAPAGTLSLAFGLSEIAHGRITALDLDAVRAAPGVVDVFTAADLPFANDVSPSAHDEPLLADGTVHYVGQPVFCVVADSHLAARKAARLGKVATDPLPALLTIDDALAADSRFEDGPRIYEKGDVDAALAEAPHVIGGRIEMGGQEHFYLEGQAALALPQEGGDMLVHASSQHPTEIQHKVAEASAARCTAPGWRCAAWAAASAARKARATRWPWPAPSPRGAPGGPAKMRYDRDDDMVITGKRHDFRIDYRAGFDAEGRILGVDFTQYARCGWAQDLSLPVADRAMLHADNAYHLPAARITSHRLKTNTQSATAFRGFGGPQGMVGIERVMDQIAHALGRDPLEVRQLNFYAAPAPKGPGTGKRFGGAHSPKSAETTAQTTPYHMPVEDFVLHEMTEELRPAPTTPAAAGGRRVERGQPDRQARPRADAGEVRHLLHADPSEPGRRAGACLPGRLDPHEPRRHRDGPGPVPEGGAGGGASFGVPIEAVKITATDTAKVPNTSATAASSGSDLNGMAVRRLRDHPRPHGRHLAAEHQAAPRTWSSPTARCGRAPPTASPRPRCAATRGASASRPPGSTRRPSRPGTGSRGAGGRSTTSPMAPR
jgi:xanthine dehydrogenase large subunit